MEIYENLDLDIGKGEVVSIVGAGGKTTTLFLLAEELKELDKKVLVTTTTAIYNPEEGQYDYYILGDIEDGFNPKNHSITVFGERIKDGKLIGPYLPKLEEIMEKGLFDFVLIEADGAKKKPIKAPASYEPVVTVATTKTIGIIGLDCLGKRIGEIVHRPEIFIKVTRTDYFDIIDEENMVKLILSPEGLFKGACGEKILLLNKACNEKSISKGINIKKMLLEKGFKGKVLVSDIQRKKFY